MGETVIKRNLLGIYTVFKNAHSAIELATNGLGCTRHKPEDGAGNYKFFVIRNPLDRLVSGWSFFTKKPVKDSYKALGLYQGMGFDEFADIILEDPSVNPHFDHQWKFLGGHKMDKICPIEQLNEQWVWLSEEFTLNPLPNNFNKSYRSVFGKYYSKALRKKAEYVFKQDLELYNSSIK